MLDLGFPTGTRSGPDDGATALHLAAAAGGAGTVRLLLDRGADIEARDATWNSARWSRPVHRQRRPARPIRTRTGPPPSAPFLTPAPPPAGSTLSPDNPEPPSPEVATLLRARGIPGQTEGTTSG